jgi:isochorismate synthase
LTLRLRQASSIIVHVSVNFKTEDAMKSEIKYTKEGHETCSQGREQWIKQALTQAQANADGDGSALLQLIIPSATQADPWRRLPANTQNTPFIAWHDPKRQLSLLGRGQALGARFQGPDRFAKLHKEQQRLHKLRHIAKHPSLPDSPDHTPPLAFAGFAFAEGNTHSDSCPWQKWPDSLLIIPEELVIRGPDKICKIIINLWISNDCPEPFVIAKRIEDIEKELENPLPENHHSPESKDIQVCDLENQKDWTKRVDAVSNAVRALYLDKVVLARAVEFLPGPKIFDRKNTLLKLRGQHPDSLTFAINLEDSCFLGSTPETLIHLNNGAFETHALAGTTPRSADPLEDQKSGQALLDSCKNRREQGIVTVALIEALRPLSKSLDVADQPSLRRLPKVQHLETRISGQLLGEEHFQSSHIFTLLSHMHPTPAVGGHPFGRARQWLEDREALHRGWYAGPIGWIDGLGNGTFAVAIRSALVTPHKVLAYAGAGIVADSEAALEWQETNAKFETIRSALTLSDQS